MTKQNATRTKLDEIHAVALEKNTCILLPKDKE